jgi:hypothetical protein
LGVLRYAIGHNLDATDVCSSGCSGRLESMPVLDDGDAGSSFRMVQERLDGSPALFEASSRELASVLSLLTQHMNPCESGTPLSSPPPSRRKIVLFGGYCKWSRGQLEQEVQRGLWKVCNNATTDDILGPDVGRLWADLNEDSVQRLIPFDNLFE